MRFPAIFQRSLLLVTCWSILCLGISGSAIGLETVSSKLPEQISERLLADAGDGSLDDFTLFKAALVAGGIDDVKLLAEFSIRFEELVRRLENKIPHDATSHQRARLVLEYLHEQIATGSYQAELARLDETLSHGVYNCLTATILYGCLSERLDLPVVSASSPGHVWCRLKSQADLDVETTCRNWFEIMNDPAQNGTARSRMRKNTAREITPVQLLAKVYYNRSLSLLEQSRFSEAVALLKISTQWDSDDQAARDNLLAGINNWALSLCDTQQYSEAVEMLNQGRQIAPQYRLFATNDVYIRHRWALHLRNMGQHARAKEVIRQGFSSSTMKKLPALNLTSRE